MRKRRSFPTARRTGQKDPEQTLPSSRGRREAATANFSLFPADDLKGTDRREGQVSPRQKTAVSSSDSSRSNPIQPAGSWRDIGEGHAKTSAEDDSHPVRRPEAAIEGDGLQRPVASFQHHACRINAGALDELMRSDPGRLHEMSDQVPGTHADDSGKLQSARRPTTMATRTMSKPPAVLSKVRPPFVCRSKRAAGCGERQSIPFYSGRRCRETRLPR